MTTYKVKIVWSKKPSSSKAFLMHDDYFTERIVPKTFLSLKDARAYAIKRMDNDRRIFNVQISNPKYADIWQVATDVARAENGKYYWDAVRPWQTVGAGHYLNKDGTISKNIYRKMR